MVPEAVLTTTCRIPSVNACSSLYHTRICFGKQSFVTDTVNARSTSLSLKTTLVRLLMLMNGYGFVQAVNGLHLPTDACAVALHLPSPDVTDTTFVTVQQTTLVAVNVTLPPAGIERIGLPGTSPSLSSNTWTFETVLPPVFVIV